MSSYSNLQPLPQARTFFRLPLVPAACGACALLLSDWRADNQATRPANTWANRCLFLER